MNRLTDVFGDSAVVAEDVRKTAYELEDKHNIASYPLLEAADHIESLYAEAVKMQAEIDALKAQNAELLAAQQWRDIESAPKDGTDFLIDYEGVTIARWMPDGSQYPWIFLDLEGGKFVFNRLRESVVDLVWRHKPLGWEAITKARGESV